MIFSTTNYYLIKAKSKKSRICVSTFLYRTLHLKKKKWFKNSHDYSDFLTFPNYMYYDNDVQCLLLSITASDFVQGCVHLDLLSITNLKLSEIHVIHNAQTSNTITALADTLSSQTTESQLRF